MFTLATEKSMSHSYAKSHSQYANASVNYSILWLFKGNVPQSFDDIPEEWLKNPTELARNCVGMVQIRGDADFQPGSTTFNYTHYASHIQARGNVWSPILNRWLLDSTNLMQRTHKGIEGYTTEELASQFTSPANVYDQYRRYFTDLTISDVYNFSVYDYHPSRMMDQSTINSNFGRYAYNYPVIFEFTQEQFVDSVFMTQHTSSSYAVDYVDVQAWDSTLNEGQGDWGESFRVLLTDGGDPNVSNFEGVTTSKLRCIFNQTYSQAWYFTCIRWLSTVEPSDVTEPYDVTWGLVSWVGSGATTSFDNYPDLKFSRFENETLFNQNQGYPYLLVDVGSPGDDTSVVLNNAESVEPQDELHVLHMGLTFKDN